MKVYCVFEGGGVKGVALAGALATAEESGVEVIGYGGSSVGAIIATLGAAGLSGEEIGKEIKERNFIKFLSFSGFRLSVILYTLRFLPGTFFKIRSFRAFVQWFLLTLIWLVAAALSIVLIPYSMVRLGIYNGSALTKTTLEILNKKQPGRFNEKTTFADLDKMGGKPLRILASDITYRRGELFSLQTTPEMPILDAIRASAGYPYVFRPSIYKNEKGDLTSYLIDGGITTNLPSHLFMADYEMSGINTLVLDLVQVEEHRPLAQGTFTFTWDLINTALDSSDEIITSMAIGIIHIPVEIGNDVGTLDFNLNAKKRADLYEQGKISAANELKRNIKFNTLRIAGDEIQRNLIKNHGPAETYGAVLYSIITDIADLSEKTAASDIRACIILPTGDLRQKSGQSLMVTYTAGFDSGQDSALELEEGEGAAWDLWRNSDSDFIVADLTDTKFTATLPPKKQSKIPKDRKSLILFKIKTQNLDSAKNRPFGILGIDSSVVLAETGWAQGNDINTDIFVIIEPWLKVIPLIMRGHLL